MLGRLEGERAAAAATPTPWIGLARLLVGWLGNGVVSATAAWRTGGAPEWMRRHKMERATGTRYSIPSGNYPFGNGFGSNLVPTDKGVFGCSHVVEWNVMGRTRSKVGQRQARVGCGARTNQPPTSPSDATHL